MHALIERDMIEVTFNNLYKTDGVMKKKAKENKENNKQQRVLRIYLGKFEPLM